MQLPHSKSKENNDRTSIENTIEPQETNYTAVFPSIEAKQIFYLPPLTENLKYFF